jgi:hypothetical protein
MRSTLLICIIFLSMMNIFRAFKTHHRLSPFPRFLATTRPEPSRGGKVLVIVESPAKARTIQKFAPPNYIIDSSAGHIRELVSKKDFGKTGLTNYMVIPELKVSAADLGIDVENKFHPIYSILDRKVDIVKRLQSKIAGCSEVLLATDEDREGEVSTLTRSAHTFLLYIRITHCPPRSLRRLYPGICWKY